MRFKYYLRGAGIGVIAATIILSVAFLLHDNISDEEVIRRAMKLGMVMQENTPGTLGDHNQSDASAVDLENGSDPESGVKADSDPLTDPSQTNSDGANGGQTNSDTANPNQGSTDPSDGAAQPAEPSQTSSSESDGNAGKQPDDSKGGNAAQPSSDQANNTDKSDGSESDEKKDKPAKKDSSDSKKEDKEDEVEIVIAAGDVSRMVSAKVHEAGLVEDADEFNAYLGAHDYDNMLQPGTYKIKKGSSFRQIAKILTKQ